MSCRRQPARSRKSRRFAPSIAVALGLLLGGAAGASAQAAERIVTLHNGVDAATVAAQVGAKPTQLFETAMNGFAADLTTAQERRLTSDRRVRGVTPDRQYSRPEPRKPSRAPDTQVTAAGPVRIGALESPTADVDGRDDQRVNADIAIIDSGIDRKHPDLNVVGGKDCSGSGTYADVDGHGTLVGGAAAAIDNRIGVVGAAPGARLWGLRIVDPSGVLRQSYVLCAVEWVARHSRTIDVANMSFSDDEGSDSETCGLADGRVRDPLHLAICTGTARGVVFVAAAGNEAVDVAAPTRQVVPAAYEEVITVSAYADYDGSRRGVGANTCGGEPHFEEDDTLAFFSNFGRDVDLAAPGVCILSTFPGGQYGVADGTSFAAPFVAGAAALIKARDPRVLTPQVNARLRALGEPGPLPQDPDGFPEPLLDIGTL